MDTKQYFRFICKGSNVYLINLLGAFANYNIYMIKNCNFKNYFMCTLYYVHKYFKSFGLIKHDLYANLDVSRRQ